VGRQFVRPSYYNPTVTISRRSLLASATALPLLAKSSTRVLKIIVAGGHPGDPVCGCAGTIARYTELGHEVVLLYLNRGEGFCGGARLGRCADIRTAEARKACESLNARAAFAGQYDGRAIVDTPHYEVATAAQPAMPAGSIQREHVRRTIVLFVGDLLTSAESMPGIRAG